MNNSTEHVAPLLSQIERERQERIESDYLGGREPCELERENRDLRELVTEMYEWTHYKHTPWAERAAKVLGMNKALGLE